MEAVDDSPIAQAHRLVHAIGLLVERASGGELDQAEALVLWHLERAGPSSLSAVHRIFGHRRSTLTSVVDRLEQRRLVRRRNAPSDRRSFVLSLTPTGRKAARSVDAAFRRLELGLERALGSEAARGAGRVLAHLIDAAERADPAPSVPARRRKAR